MDVSVEDYQCLPLGTKLETGTVQLCPYCGNIGILEVVNEMAFCTHSLVKGYGDKQQPILLWDMCPKEGTPRITIHE